MELNFESYVYLNGVWNVYTKTSYDIALILKTYFGQNVGLFCA